ncbi:MAG: GGDEF domain-containing protein, partial [Candidatus Acidulodesulfobacterium sp.]
SINVLNNAIAAKQKENIGIIKKLNLLNNLSYKLSSVYTLEYAVKTFAEGLCSIKNQNGSTADSLHINMFDAVNKKTVTSLIYTKNKSSSAETDKTENADKIILKTANIDYEDYLSNCKLLKNGKSDNHGDTVDNCEFKGTAGSYMCFSLKISDELAGTISIDSEDKHFFTQEIIDLVKEIINIASPVFAKLILIETNRELALTDSLTGIHNRRFMYEFVKREIVRAARNSADLTFAILDIDKFKNINDNYGHNIGDIMLVEFTNDLKSVLLRKQDIITRYGGDEFVVVLPDTGKEKALNLMEKLRVYIENKIYAPKENLNLNITISVGVSDLEQFFYDKGAENEGKNIDPDEILNDMLKIADDNLYRAKELGRNKVVG